MLWVEGVGSYRSKGLLTQNFSVETDNRREERKKKQKRKKGGLWKLTPLMEIRPQRGFPQRLGKHKTLYTVPTGPTAGFLPEEWGEAQTRAKGDIVNELTKGTF